MTTFDIFVPLFFLGLAGLAILYARHSAKRLEAERKPRTPAE